MKTGVNCTFCGEPTGVLLLPAVNLNRADWPKDLNLGIGLCVECLEAMKDIIRKYKQPARVVECQA